MAYISKIKTPNNTTYDINAYKTKAIPTGSVDSTSTSTVYTATVDGITELRNGVCMLLTNSVVNSAANFTININNLGAKPVYGTMNTATRIATVFKKGYTLFFVYNETRVSGGCWDFVYYDNNNTVTQTHSTTNAEKNLLMSATTSTTTTKTEGTYKSTKLTFNPSTGILKINSNALLPLFVDSSGYISIDYGGNN
jgi:hypothetical protein